MTDALFLHIQKLLPDFIIPRAEMAPFFQTLSVKKNTVLLAEKEPCNDIYFVNKGCLYLYYDQAELQEVIHFALEDWWITDYKTFAETQPAVYAIAALEDSELTRMSRKDYETLQLQFPAMARYFNKIHERAYGAALFKQKTYATVSKSDFYRHFRNTYPALLQRIPHDIFASYMGISLETLAQIRDAFVS